MNKNYRIAIVEDEKSFREQLVAYLKQYEEEQDVSFQITEYFSKFFHRGLL